MLPKWVLKIDHRRILWSKTGCYKRSQS